VVTDKQQKANQANAQLGGVKTLEGKMVSRFNASKHGILRVSLTDYEKEFYPNLLEDLEAEYRPQGTVEQMLIERIAINYFKLFRLQKAETEYMKSLLDPRKLIEAPIWGVVNEGYTPQVQSDGVEKLSSIYARYETTIENRLFRALHELERIQKSKNGERTVQPLAVDVNQMGSFGESE
jgi:hypothetical protein